MPEDAPELNHKKVTAAILAGAFDGHLVDMMEAIRRRFTDRPGAVRWRLSVCLDGVDVDVTEDDLTMAEAELIEDETGLSWAQIDPQRSAKACKALLTVVLQTRSGKSSAEARKLVGAATTSQVVDGIDVYEVDPDPTGAASETA